MKLLCHHVLPSSHDRVDVKTHAVPCIRTVILRIVLFLDFDGNITSPVAYLFPNH